MATPSPLSNYTEDAYYQMSFISPPEWAVISIGILVHSVNLVVLAYIHWNRDYAPLKLKQIPFVTIQLLGIRSCL